MGLMVKCDGCEKTADVQEGKEGLVWPEKWAVLTPQGERRITVCGLKCMEVVSARRQALGHPSIMPGLL